MIIVVFPTASSVAQTLDSECWIDASDRETIDGTQRAEEWQGGALSLDTDTEGAKQAGGFRSPLARMLARTKGNRFVYILSSTDRRDY